MSGGIVYSPLFWGWMIGWPIFIAHSFINGGLQTNLFTSGFALVAGWVAWLAFAVGVVMAYRHGGTIDRANSEEA